MCSGCGGDVESGGYEQVPIICVACGEEYPDQGDGDVLPCLLCEEPICYQCRKGHEDSCMARKDCLSD